MNTYTIVYEQIPQVIPQVTPESTVTAHYYRHELGWITFKDEENKVVCEVSDRNVQRITRTGRDIPDRKTIADQVRRHCTPDSTAYTAGGDTLIAAVADWIENPPEWVTERSERTGQSS